MSTKTKTEFMRSDSSRSYDFNTMENTTDLKVTQFYINNTNRRIRVINRSNYVHTVVPSGGFSDNFIVRQIYKFNGSTTIVSAINSLNDIIDRSKVKLTELEILRDALTEAYRNSHGSPLCTYDVTIDKTISGKRIRSTQSVYITEADLLIQDETFPGGIVHPFSEQGIHEQGISDFVSGKKTSGVLLELIDNENKINTRYIYVAKKVMSIPTHKDSQRASGVYCTRIDHDHFDTEFVTEYFTYEEAEVELGIFRTEEDAISGGDPELLARIAEDTIRKELAEMKARTEREKLESDQRIRLLQEELEERKMRRNDHYDDKRHRRDDYYEDRSHVRKDNSEFWKLTTGMLVTILTVFVAVQKTQKKT